jgi:hypothetical protein
MHPSARHFALRAAAKVAMSVSASSLGCGAMVEAARPDPEPRPDDVVAKPIPDAAVTDVAPEVIVATSCTAAKGREAFTCCVAEVEAATAADAGVVGDACCDTMIDYLEAESGSPSWSEDYSLASKQSALQICCRGLKAWSKSTCTPWGPPAPPAMEGEVA